MLLFELVLAVILTFFIYRQGIKDGMKMKDGEAPEKIFHMPSVGKALNKNEQLENVLKNIENYNGNAEGQLEI